MLQIGLFSLDQYVDLTYNGIDMYEVELEKVKKILKKLPKHVVTKLLAWASDVEKYGLPDVRKVSGYHDEPLRGKRSGQRSIRLSKAYRAIYTTSKEGVITLVIIEEVNKHDY
jgi:toxin HigB-1